MNLFKLHRLYMAEADETGSGGAVDRGDSYTPTLDDAIGDEAVPEAKKADAEPEAKKADAEDEGADTERDDKGRFIPKNRHEKILDKERSARETAEREAAELKALLKDQETGEDIQKMIDEVKAMRKNERKAMMDGDEDKAEQFSEKADALNRQIAERRSEMKMQQTKDQTREEIRVEATVERLQQQYPELDDSADAFDETLTNLVLAEQKRLISDERMSPAKALTKAAHTVMSLRSPAAAADDEGKKGLAAAQKSTDDRKEASVKRNVDASKRQPTSTKDVGVDSDKGGQKSDVDINGMSFDEFKALPEATLKRLRGDMA